MESAASGQRRVGRYFLVERLAVGGMAEVFLACERGGSHSLDRLLVVKRILPHLAEDENFVEMFLEEARIAARINHPAVVQIYELGESGGLPYMAMEYVAGSTLKELLNACRMAETLLPIDIAVHLMAQACAGAHAAHEIRGADGKLLELVHRDLSPHNLMVTNQAHVKLLDFGIAKGNLEDHQRTRTGMLKGKISYMSPEQCRQDPLDRRSDIFALGIVMWELLSGRKMFLGKSELAIMQAIVNGNLPDIREYRPDIPEPLARVMDKALQVELDDRFRTADDMRKALLDAARDAGVSVDADRSARFVHTMLGQVHEQRSQHLNQALEKSLMTLSSVEPAPAGIDPIDTSNSGLNGPAMHPEPTTLTQTQLTTTAGVAGAVGFAAGAVGLVLALGAGIGFAWWSGAFDNNKGGGEPAALANAAPPDPPGQALSIAVPPTIDADSVADELGPLDHYLTRTVNRKIQLVVSGDYDGARKAVMNGHVDFALLPYRTLKTTLAEKPDLRVLAFEEIDGSKYTDGYLVVHRDSTVSDVKELKGKTICYSDPLSNTGYKMPREFLKSKGVDPENDLEARISGTHADVLRDLVAGKCDVGATYSNNYLTANDEGIPVAQLRILVAQTGKPSPHDAIVASDRVDDATVDAVRAALLEFDPQQHLGSPRLGTKKRITGYIEPNPGWLDL